MKISTLTCLGLASTATCEITCGISSGYDKGEKAYFFSGDGSLANFDACSARCQSDSKCQSFAFDSSQCLLYASALDSNFRQQSNSPFLFYDRDCVDVKATSSFTTVLPPTTAPAAGAAATPTPASATPGTGGSGGGNGGSGGDSSSSSESGSAPTAQAVSTTDGTNTALPGSGGAPGGQLGASKTTSSGFSTATATGTGASGESGSSATRTSSSGSSSSTGSSSSSGSSSSGSSSSGAAVTAAEGFRMLVLGSLCALAVIV